MPQVTELQFDGRLTNVSKQYKNEEYIAEIALPDVPVPQKTGVYKTFTKEDRFTIPDTMIGPKGHPNEVEWSTGEASFACKDYGLGEYLSQEEIDNAEAPISPQSETTDFVTDLVLLDKEQRTKDAIFLATNYAAGNQVDKAGAWATLTTSTVVDDMETGIDACFMRPNVLIMGISTWRKFSRSDQLLDVIGGTLNPRQASIEQVQTYFELDAVLIGRARKNTAAAGQTPSYSRVWDGTTTGKGGAALIRTAGAGGGLKNVTSFQRFAWKNRQVFTQPSDRGAFGGQNIRVVESNVLKNVSTDVGYLFIDTELT